MKGLKIMQSTFRWLIVLSCIGVLSSVVISGCNRETTTTVAPQPAMNSVSTNDAEKFTTKLEFKTQPQQVTAGQNANWILKVLKTGTDDEAVKEFEFVHDKLIHLIVVSKDLSYFNHIHPEYKGNGVFIITTSLPRAGEYKLYADYTPRNGEHNVAQQTLRIGGANPLPSTPKLIADKMQGAWLIKRVTAHLETQPASKSGDTYEVALMPMPAKLVAGQSAMLHFQVRDASGKPIKDLQMYLGALGHCVILSSDSNTYLHTHPMSGDPMGGGMDARKGTQHGEMQHDETKHELPQPSGQLGGPNVIFHTNFPRPGLYKVWGQFRHHDKIITAPFVLNVSGGAGTPSSPASNAAPQAKRVVYTCPMHPEVTSSKPGKCPKCGMDLVKRQ